MAKIINLQPCKAHGRREIASAERSKIVQKAVAAKIGIKIRRAKICCQRSQCKGTNSPQQHNLLPASLFAHTSWCVLESIVAKPNFFCCFCNVLIHASLIQLCWFSSREIRARVHSMIMNQSLRLWMVRLLTFRFTQSTGVCKLFEAQLKQTRSQQRNITYDISELYQYLDSMTDASCLVFNQQIAAYEPRNKDWLKQQVYLHLKRMAGQA